MKFFLKTQTPSQKNSKTIAINRKTGKPFIMTNKRVQDWQKEVSMQLVGKKYISGPVKISMQFINKDKRKRDIDNMQTSILDLLKNNGIIEDDNCFIVQELHSSFLGVDSENYGVNIEIKSL